MGIAQFQRHCLLEFSVELIAGSNVTAASIALPSGPSPVPQSCPITPHSISSYILKQLMAKKMTKNLAVFER
jgi:hypothetical protein